MNTYNENLQQTVANTLSALSGQQDSVHSKRKAAQYSLYYAQGAEITARDKLHGTKELVKFLGNVNDQSLICGNQIFNLLASVNQANGNVTVSRTNSATAAANIQVASNAISALASDIGAALNIASASMYGTDTYDRIVEANNFVVEVANDARKIAMQGMDASSKTSEIIATEMLNQTSSVKSKIDKLMLTTQADYDKFSNQIITENQTVGQATKTERQAEGVLKDARSEEDAIVNAYGNANKQLNFDLKVAVLSAKKISVSFQALPVPFPQFRSSSGDDIPKDTDVAGVSYPRYFLAIVPEDKKGIFSVDQAQQLFAQRAKDNTQFVPLTAGLVNEVGLSSDVYQNPIAAGSNYVAYLYVELSLDYKRYIANFSDMLSAATRSFTPADMLPVAVAAQFTPAAENAAKPGEKHLYFSAPWTKGSGPVQGIEFRCILVEKDKAPELNLMRCPSNEKSAIFFNLSVAEQVAPANYEVAKIWESVPGGLALNASPAQTEQVVDDGSVQPPGCVNPQPAVSGRYDCQITFDSATTDHFGNQLRPGVSYQPYILTTVNPSGDGKYLDVLSGNLSAMVIF